MQLTDTGVLDPHLVQRLRLEIGRLVPPATPLWQEPAARRRLRWQPMTAGVALVLIGLFALSGIFLTGSSNPDVWVRSAQDAVRSTVTAPSTPSPTPGGSRVQGSPDAGAPY